MFIKKHRKKRKKHYITGTHISPKCIAPIKFRSSWEKTTCEYFDMNKEIISYKYESVVIPYISNIKTKKTRNYYPDFLVYYLDGSIKLIEVKRKSQINNLINIKKFNAAKIWCHQNNASFEIVSEEHIKQYKKILSTK